MKTELRLNIRISAEEKELIERCAKSEFLPPSTWGRAVILKECERIKKKLKTGK